MLLEGSLRAASIGCLVVAILCAVPAEVRAQDPPDAGGASAQILPLVTEKVVRAGEEAKPQVQFWWQNATEPNWTGTDRALRDALLSSSARLMQPSGDVRVSRIYRRPELSIDNAAALASVLDARRILVGEVTYTVRGGSVLPRSKSIGADATLQLVDVASSEPTVIQTIRFERTLYGDSPAEKLLEQARKEVGKGAGALLDRTVAAASGPVGIDSEEGYLVFHDVAHGEALERIRSFLADLDVVEKIRVRWASEGLVALEVDPRGEKETDAVAYAGRTLVNHKFDQMTVQRRQKSLGGNSLEFSVSLADDFGEVEDRNQEDERGE